MDTFGVAFMIGLASSIHCVAMCGTFIASVTEFQKKTTGFNIVMTVGRLSSYMLIGALAGSFGSLLFQESIVSRAALVFALILVLFYGTAILIGREKWVTPKMLWFDRLAAPFFPVNSYPKAYFCGAILALLPCPVLHSVASFAVMSGNFKNGALVMLFFGFGNSLTLVSASVLFNRFFSFFRMRYHRLVGVLIIASGVLSFFRLINGH